MGVFAKGDIVLFPFPYTDLSDRKLRPCLTISDQMQRDIILCQITSQDIKRDEFSVALNKDETIDGSIHIDSYIRCNMIFTASQSQILKKLCSINQSKYQDVVHVITQIIKK